jgi:hypothetical protein
MIWKSIYSPFPLSQTQQIDYRLGARSQFILEWGQEAGGEVISNE